MSDTAAVDRAPDATCFAANGGCMPLPTDFCLDVCVTNDRTIVGYPDCWEGTDGSLTVSCVPNITMAWCPASLPHGWATLPDNCDGPYVKRIAPPSP